MSDVAIRRALLSVSDKAYLEELARGLAGFGVELLATGGTAERLKRAGIRFRSVEGYTGNPEAFDGRMKTISFKLESALLFDRANPSHVEQAGKLGIEPIDLVACNFYPFEDAVSAGKTESELVHEIDVGGPTMVRAAAKNYGSVLVLTDPADYAEALAQMRRSGGAVSLELRRRMMAKAFERTQSYDLAIFDAFGRRPLRYGENPHQPAYFTPSAGKGAIDWVPVAEAALELSYNNMLDAQAAFGAMGDAKRLAHPGHGACAIVKHNNPCGMATASTIEEAFLSAWAGDPISAFGGVVALSAPLTIECARLFAEKFVEVVLAPDFEEGALDELKRGKKKLRVLRLRSFDGSVGLSRVAIEGGTLVQGADDGAREELRSVTQRKFPRSAEGLARFGVACAKWLKSNAVAIAREGRDGGYQLVGMGCGQPNRVDAIRRLAIPKAREVLASGGPGLGECVLASDAFFPFPDSVEEAAAAGIKLIVQPGGSMRDNEVIAACDRLGVAMAFTGRRHFRH